MTKMKMSQELENLPQLLLFVIFEFVLSSDISYGSHPCTSEDTSGRETTDSNSEFSCLPPQELSDSIGHGKDFARHFKKLVSTTLDPDFMPTKGRAEFFQHISCAIGFISSMNPSITRGEGTGEMSKLNEMLKRRND